MNLSEIFGGLLSLSTFGVSVRAVLLALVGIVVTRLIGRAVARLLEERLDAHRAQLGRRAVVYLVGLLFTMSVLREFGFDLSVLIGAAGVLTVAIGFASQTSAANVVSGLFLLGERPFAIGDVVRVGATTGEVIHIGLLSVKLRTFDNLQVRVPNETLVRAEITNLTAFPIRRIDIAFSVAYKDDLAKLEPLLIELVDRNPLCLEEPRPVVILTGFLDSGVGVQLSVWVQRERFLEVRNQIYVAVKDALASAGFEIPFPHVSLYAGERTEPIPLRLAGERGELPDPLSRALPSRAGSAAG